MDIGGPPSHPNRDEVIADSEEELEYARSFSALTTLHTNAVSSISDFTTIPHPGSDEIVSHSTADRTRTRQRTQETKKVPVVQDDIIELTSEDDVVEKSTKSSARSIKPKLKAKMVDKPLLEASKSHDSSGSRPRVRPRPKPIVKRVQPKLDSLPLHQYPFACDSFVYDPAFYRRQPDLPIATSPATINHTMGHGVISQLPPSDPPNSTNTTGIGGKSSRPEDSPLPPIEILQDGGSEHDGDSRLLSPSSLFSDKGGSRSKAKKRNRGVALDIQDKEHEVDQLIPSSPHCREPTPHVAVDAYTHGPPPTFFAGSSSSAVRDNGERDPTPFPNPQAEVIDLTDLPPTMKPSKPNKIKKQMVNNEVIPTEGLHGDEGDSDFKPGKKAVKKRKGKGKEPVVDQKENKPKEKKDRTRKKKQQLDGVVLAKRTKTKGKPIEKEVFKSREVIDDSDDGTDPLLLVGGMQVDDRMHLPSTTDGTSSLRVSDLNQGGLSSASDKSPRSKIDEPNSSTSASAVSKEKTKSKGKKRKSIVESDEEGSEKGEDIQDRDCIVVKRRKSASGAPVYDGVEQEQVDNKKKSQESVGSGKGEPEVPKTPGSAGANQDETKDSDVCQRTRVQKVGKENMSSGPSAPSVARPRRTASINPDSSTPLYARYEVAPRRSSLPMSELIRRASIKPGSPFSASFTPSHKDRSKGKKPGSDVDAASNTPQSLTTYSPYLKMSRRALSKIAPLHLNRRTPPPPAPAPPPKKKTKKEIEREEKWEEELVETIGIDVWASMEDSERKEMRRAKIDMEMGGYDD